MARGTLFGTVHTSTALHLIQQKQEVGPAIPKINLLDVPGGNGSVDLTEVLGTGVVFKDRTVKWTYALYPGENWAEKRSEVSNAINGKRLHITMDDDPTWYYDGRVTVSDYKADNRLYQITVEATCAPYKRKITESSVSATLSTVASSIALAIGQMPLVPKITVEQETTIAWGDYTVTVATGTHLLPDLLMSGAQTIQAQTTSGSGTITITWREGSL
nr:MAG TPA: distal tail protein [Caudoviricetes sp.]